MRRVWWVDSLWTAGLGLDAVADYCAGLNGGSEAMMDLDSEYPTPEQIEEMFLAYKHEGKDGILRVLRKRREERLVALAQIQPSQHSRKAE